MLHLYWTLLLGTVLGWIWMMWCNSVRRVYELGGRRKRRRWRGGIDCWRDGERNRHLRIDHSDTLYCTFVSAYVPAFLFSIFCLCEWLKCDHSSCLHQLFSRISTSSTFYYLLVCECIINEDIAITTPRKEAEIRKCFRTFSRCIPFSSHNVMIFMMTG